jgi:hypothetical protein
VTTAATDEDGLELELGEMPVDAGFGRSPRCCTKARYIMNHRGDGPFSDNPGKYACVCNGKSYCPDHGIRCNGSHD